MNESLKTQMWGGSNVQCEKSLRPCVDGDAYGCVRSCVMKSELLKSRKMSLTLWHCRELFSAIQLASSKAHKHAHKTKNDKFNIQTLLLCLEKRLFFFFFYSWSTPVEFGEDTSTQGVYCLQHMWGEFRELWSLMESTQWHQNMLEFVGSRYFSETGAIRSHEGQEHKASSWEGPSGLTVTVVVVSSSDH